MKKPSANNPPIIFAPPRVGRRFFLGTTAAALAAAALQPDWVRAQTAVDRYLVLILAYGGLRSIDLWDAYPASTETGLHTDYETEDTLPVSSDWSLAPTAAPLQPFVDRMALVRHVFMETATHDVGVRIGMCGSSRSTSSGGSVVVANSATLGETVHGITPFSLSFPFPVPADGLTGSVTGEPDVLQAVMSRAAFTTSASYDALLRERIAARHASIAANAAAESHLRSWAEVSTFGNRILDEEVGALLYESEVAAAYEALTYSSLAGGDANVDAASSGRYAGAFSAIRNNVTRVVTIGHSNFDTHEDPQYDLCAELATLLGRLMGDLDAEGLLEKTTIAVMSDFDRTYTSNGSGTDHYLYGSLALFGAGVNAGIYGPEGGSPERGLYPGDLDAAGVTGEALYMRKDVWASIYASFGLDHADYFPDARVINGLFT